MAFPASLSSNNPFRPLTADPWSQPSAYPGGAIDETPSRPTIPHNAAPVPRTYVPTYRNAGRQPHFGYVDEDSESSGNEFDRTYSHRRHHESVSGYIADKGPKVKPITLNANSFPADEKLALEKGNFKEWETRVSNTIGLYPGALRYLDPTVEPPSFDMYPRSHQQWLDNDQAIRSFIVLVCASSEHAYFEDARTAAAVWATIRNRHTKRGPLDQVNKLREAMGIKFEADPSTWADTAERISKLNKAVWAGGAPTADGIHTVLLIHALSGFPSFVDSLLAVPDLDPAYITARLAAKREIPPESSTTAHAFAALSSNSNSKATRDICNNPSCAVPTGHTYPYCVAKGGGMAGKSIAEAREKKRADDGKSGKGKDKKRDERKDSASHKVGRDKDGYACITINGEDFRLVSTPPAPPAATLPPCANYVNLHTDELPVDSLYDLETFLALEEPQVSVDWGEYTVNAAAQTRTTTEYELYSDSGANIHITPCRDDFATFSAIPPRAIKGFQGSSINATGVGTIVNDKFSMVNALYVPDASIRLMSVSRLCQDNAFTCHFDAATTWITDTDGNIICTGTLSKNRDLYKLHCSPIPLPAESLAASASIDRMHRRLGHAHPQAVADLYQHQLVDG